DQALSIAQSSAKNGDNNSASAINDSMSSSIIVNTSSGPQTFGLTFPILQNPLGVVNLMLGNYSGATFLQFSIHDPVASVHIGLKTPTLKDFLSSAPSWVQDAVSFVQNAIPVHLIGNLALDIAPTINLGAGYDAVGLAEYAVSHDPGDLIDGFYVNAGT